MSEELSKLLNLFKERKFLIAEKKCFELIKRIKPNVLIKGGEYQLEEIVGSSYVKSYGGDVKTIKMHKRLSTTDASTYL